VLTTVLGFRVLLFTVYDFRVLGCRFFSVYGLGF